MNKLQLLFEFAILMENKTDRSVCPQSCEICQEQFEMYWEEDEEEWHLKNAIRVDEKVRNVKRIRFRLVTMSDCRQQTHGSFVFLSDIPSPVL